MGCKTSKEPAHSIRVVQSASHTRGKKRISPSEDTNLKRNKFASNPDIFSANSTKSKSRESLDDQDSLFGGTDSRHSSAGSKGSKHSADSGFDPEVDDGENHWGDIITEDSEPTLVHEIEDTFNERDGLGESESCFLSFRKRIDFF